MPETNISSAKASDLANAFTDFEVAASQTDGPSDQKETEWMNVNWSSWFGYYKDIPELSSVIDAKATWTVGKGFKADSETTAILDNIRGWGKDTFNTILENCIRTYNIGGDAFCEIIRDDDGALINLKPLDPGTIKIVVNAEGILIRYEQVSKIGGQTGKVVNKFNPEDIFHLPRNRVADEIHGVSITAKLSTIILMKNEAMDDWKRVLHRNIDPMIAYKLDTDNESKILAFKTKVDAAKGKGDNMYLPKDTVEFEIISLAPNANLNPLTWIDTLDNKFYEAAQVPKIIVGGAGGITEAAVKIAYLAWQQTVEEEQLFVEEQVGMQLGLAIELEFPASLENELLSDKKKDGPENIQPNETTAGSGQ